MEWLLLRVRRFFMAYISPAKPVTVRLFYLNDELESTADKLRDQFMKRPTNKTELLNTPAPDIKVLPCKVLFELTSPEIDSTDGTNSYSDVVVILGHSNVFSFGPLDISDILEALLHPKPPSFVVFLGCCGGNGRYGPLTMLSQLPEWRNTVFSFFQRRIYIDELCQTSPVLGIQYYVHLVRADSVKETKDNIHRAFTDANRDPRSDIALLLNCKEEQTAQTILKMVKSFNILTEEIPRSCWQLVMYHTFTVEEGPDYEQRSGSFPFTFPKKPTIIDFIVDTKRRLESLAKTENCSNEKVKEMLITKLDEKCVAELDRRRLNDIIELACEIQLIQVTEETFKSLRNNDWKQVDHLQFFVAMVHGYWGKNDYNALREYATYHIMKVMKSVATAATSNEHELQTYHLCCVGYCLFAPEIYIISDENYACNKTFGFCLWDGYIPFYFALRSCLDVKDPKKYINVPIGQENKYKTVGYYVPKDPVSLESVITPQGYQWLRNDRIVREPCLTELNVLPINEDELPWDDVFSLRRKDCGFVKLLTKEEEKYFPMHNFLKCSSCTGNIKCEYQYNKNDLVKALNALQDYFFSPTDASNSAKNDQTLKRLYCVKEFTNKSNQKDGHIKTFTSSYGISCVEMRVIHDLDEVKYSEIKKGDLVNSHEVAWPKVSRCRFVFVYANTNKRKTRRGTLFFTNSHYGQDLIDDKPKTKADMYRLQQKFIDTQKEKFISILRSRLESEFPRLRENLLELFTQKDLIPKELPSLQNLLNYNDCRDILIKKNWYELLNGWLVEKLLVEKLRVVAKTQCYLKSLLNALEEVLVEMVQDSVKYTKNELTKAGTFPFVEIGVLTLKDKQENEQENEQQKKQENKCHALEWL